METFNTVFEIAETINCPLYARGDRLSLTDKTLSCPEGKEVCLILVRDMTQLLFVMLADKSAVDETQLHNCSGCTGLIKFRQMSGDEISAGEEQGKSRMQALLHELHGREVASPFLDSIPNDKVNSVMAKFRQVTVPRKTLLVRQGETNHNLYLILTGAFSVEINGKPIGTLQEGDVFGEASYLGADQAMGDGAD